MEISECIRALLQKGHQWRLPVVVIRCDISKAFDSLSHEHIATDLEWHGTPPRLIRCVLEELTECTMSVSLQGIAATVSPLLVKGGKQGASETPALWCRYFDAAWQLAKARFVTEGLGLPLSTPPWRPEVLHGAYWADDVFLFSDSLAGAEKMLGILSEEIALLGLSWKPGACEMLYNEAACPDPAGYTLVLKTVFCPTPFSVVHKMLVLGCMIDDRGSYHCSMKYRMSQTWAA
jgi:hypothetical protein